MRLTFPRVLPPQAKPFQAFLGQPGKMGRGSSTALTAAELHLTPSCSSRAAENVTAMLSSDGGGGGGGQLPGETQLQELDSQARQCEERTGGTRLLSKTGFGVGVLLCQSPDGILRAGLTNPCIQKWSQLHAYIHIRRHTSVHTNFSKTWKTFNFLLGAPI